MIAGVARTVFALILSAGVALSQLPHHVWLEAETFGPLRGGNFSFQPLTKQQPGSWAVSGPGVADAWTQGGESEWMSVAARSDEPGQLIIGRQTEIPVTAKYELWVRYADYREKEEAFGVRVQQDGRTWEHLFGRAAVIDELDPMKLLWDWSFAWDHTTLSLTAGMARVELFTTGVTGARRQIDCLCFTTDENYHPSGREKPDFAVWSTLRAMKRAGSSPIEPMAVIPSRSETPQGWRIGDRPPVFLWNVSTPWGDELRKPSGERVEQPFAVDPPLLADFLAAHRGHEPLVYSDILSGPVWHIPEYPSIFATGSVFLEWLARHPDRPFAMLLNYGDPQWPKDADRTAPRRNVAALGERFYGYIAGESLSHTSYDSALLDTKIRAATSRAEVLAALREVHTAAVVRKFSDYYGAPVDAEAAWAPVIPCLSANMEAFCHALCEWGCSASVMKTLRIVRRWRAGSLFCAAPRGSLEGSLSTISHAISGTPRRCIRVKIICIPRRRATSSTILTTPSRAPA